MHAQGALIAQGAQGARGARRAHGAHSVYGVRDLCFVLIMRAVHTMCDLCFVPIMRAVHAMRDLCFVPITRAVHAMRDLCFVPIMRAVHAMRAVRPGRGASLARPVLRMCRARRVRRARRAASTPRHGWCRALSWWIPCHIVRLVPPWLLHPPGIGMAWRLPHLSLSCALMQPYSAA